MSQNTPENYLEEVPEDIDMSQQEWQELSYHGQYHHAERDNETKEEQRRKRRKRKKHWIDRIKAEKGCLICGEDERVCLHYHHLNEEEKQFQLSQIAYNDAGKEKIKRELNKCVVLCANCHAKHHAGIIDVEEKV